MPSQRETRRRALLFMRANKRSLFGLIGIPALISVAYFLNLFTVGGVSNRSDQVYVQFVSHTSQKTISPNIRLVYIDEEHNRALLEQHPQLAGILNDDLRRQPWREFHSQLVSKLDKAGAAIVAFDFTFPAAANMYEGANKAFIDAVRDANNHGRTHVVIGWKLDEMTDHDLSQVLATEQAGDIEVGGMSSDTGDSKSLRVIAIAISDGRTVNGVIEERLRTPIPMPLRLFTIATHKGKPLIVSHLEANQGDVALYENGTNHLIQSELMFCEADSPNCKVTQGFEWRRTAVVPLIMPSIDSRNEIPYENILSSGDLTEYKDKIVIVGARIDQEKVTVPGAESGAQLYGYQAHAAILDDLLHNR